jgi:hypothetical protein
MTFRVPKQKVDDYKRAQFATETAFNELIGQAKRLGLELFIVPGLSHLPSQELAECFREACRDILLSLTPPESHVKDKQGNEHWVGEDCS